MQVVHPIGWGIDVHQAQLTACLRRVDTDGQVTQEVRAFATTADALRTLRPWLTEEPCPVGALESTGVYGRPVSHVLVGTVEVRVGTAQARRRRPGPTTDQAEARGIAARWAHGLLRPSVIPPPPIQALRELTRRRVAWIQARTQAQTRGVTVREATTITRPRVVSDRVGRRGRRRRAALVAGARARHTRAALARGVLRRNPSQRARARTGQCPEQHAWLIQGALARSDLRDRQLTDLEPHSGALRAPVAPPLEPRSRMPGVEATAARALLAEIGTARRHCGSAARLASWAGVCAGPDERAGTRRSGRTRPGTRELRRGLGPCAGAARHPPTVLGHTCRRLAGRLGGKNAAMAGAHTMLVRVDPRLREGTGEAEARDDRLPDKQADRQPHRAVKALERLGYRVTLARLAARYGTSPLRLHAPLAFPSRRNTRVSGGSSVSLW